MTKETNMTFLSSAKERELLTMTDDTILQEVINHFEDMHDASANEREIDRRLCHSGILFAEGRRLSVVYPELGRKLILASVFWNELRGLCYFTTAERKTLIEAITKRRIQEAEDMKKQKKTKDEIMKAFIKAMLRLNYFTPNEHKPLKEYLDKLSLQDEKEWMEKKDNE